jgi:lysophospholipid acyltransferase (LPLAT)-like uncharacterized protein
MPEKGAVSPRRARGGSFASRLARSEWVLNGSAALIAGSLRFVKATSRIAYEPRSVEDLFADCAPLIITAWHGQAFMLPLMRPPEYDVDVLASRHADGELIARTLMRIGCGVVRGSGAPDPSRMHQKGGIAGFRGMLAALSEGRSVAMTADFLKNARRKVGLGVITLARLSGRPIIPSAFASSRRREIGSSWDRTTISLPFGRAACVVGDPVWVPDDADDAAMEAARAAVERSLDAVNARSLQVVDRTGG